MTKPEQSEEQTGAPPQERVGSDLVDGERRGFVGNAAGVAMAGGLVAGYGAFAWISGRYLYPAHDVPKEWLFVTDVGSVKEGASFSFEAPSGAKIVIARQGRKGDESDFIALSSVCPHLGCQVRWEGHNERFFCPCHSGTFDPSGRATGGPPAQAGQSLFRFPLKIEHGLLFIQVPERSLNASAAPGGKEETREGHDPCLRPIPISPKRG